MSFGSSSYVCNHKIVTPASFCQPWLQWKYNFIGYYNTVLPKSPNNTESTENPASTENQTQDEFELEGSPVTGPVEHEPKMDDETEIDEDPEQEENNSLVKI